MGAQTLFTNLYKKAKGIGDMSIELEAKGTVPIPTIPRFKYCIGIHKIIGNVKEISGYFKRIVLFTRNSNIILIDRRNIRRIL